MKCPMRFNTVILSVVFHFIGFGCALAESRTEETPFLWGGKIYADPNSGITSETRDRYRDIPYQYPDAASCTVVEKNIEGAVQFKNLNWSQLSNEEEVEVCLFRVLSTMKGAEQITEWLQQRGWLAREVTDAQYSAPMLGVQGPVTQLGFYWDALSNGALYGDSYERKRYLRRCRGSAATVTIDEDKGVVWIIFQNKSKWSE